MRRAIVIGLLAIACGESEERATARRQAIAEVVGEQRQEGCPRLLEKLGSTLAIAERIDIVEHPEMPQVDVFVGPAWSRVPYANREGFAFYYAICQTETLAPAIVTIRNGRTGRDIARYTPGVGYQGFE